VTPTVGHIVKAPHMVGIRLLS